MPVKQARRSERTSLLSPSPRFPVFPLSCSLARCCHVVSRRCFGGLLFASAGALPLPAAPAHSRIARAARHTDNRARTCSSYHLPAPASLFAFLSILRSLSCCTRSLALSLVMHPVVPPVCIW